MKPHIAVALRVIPVLLFVGLVFGLTTSAFATGKAVSSIRLPVTGMIDMIDEFGVKSVLDLTGTIHVVSQVYPMSDGSLLATLRANISGLKGQGDDFAETPWLGVGANHYPPDEFFPSDPVLCSVPFELISLGNELPPNPVSPADVAVNLVLCFDEYGNLLADMSTAQIGGRTLPSGDG